MPQEPRAVAAQREPEDALTYLPRKALTEYRRGESIFKQNQPSAGIYLVVRGKVRVSNLADDGEQVLIDIYGEDEFFGENGLLGDSGNGEHCVALDNVVVMSWTTREIEDMIERQPRLGLALIQVLVGRAIRCERRIESMAVEKTPQRIERSLIYFAERLGQRNGDGSVVLLPLPHQLVAEYVGTSRELVTFHMNELRRLGYVQYSRKKIDVYVDALRERLNHHL